MDLLVTYDDERDEYWRVRFGDLFGAEYDMVSPVVEAAGFDSIQDYYHWLLDIGLTQDVTVCVLLGPKTHARRRVDWDIAAALELLESRHPGLLAVRVPTHPDHGRSMANPRLLPPRLVDNLKSGYVKLYDWTEDAAEMARRLHDAQQNARHNAYMIVNKRPPMERDLGV